MRGLAVDRGSKEVSKRTTSRLESSITDADRLVAGVMHDAIALARDLTDEQAERVMQLAYDVGRSGGDPGAAEALGVAAPEARIYLTFRNQIVRGDGARAEDTRWR